MKVLKWSAIGVGAVLLVAIALLGWTLNTGSGARWAATIAQRALGGKLAIGALEGTMAGPLVVTDLRYRDPEAGIDLTAKRIALDPALRDLVRRLVHVRRVELSGIDLTLREPMRPAPPPQPRKPFTLEPPIDIAIDALALQDVAIHRDDRMLLDISDASFAGRWTRQDLAVQTLDVRSPQGEIHFAGRVGQQEHYVGEGNGRFRWTVGDQTYAGNVHAVARQNDVSLDVRLARPVRAQLDAVVQQAKSAPWRFTLDVPRFDPRDELLPGSDVRSLGASLTGQGTLANGALSGELLIDGESLHIEQMAFTREPERLLLGSVLRINDAPGEFRADAALDLAREPMHANVAAKWHDLVVPAQWAGQELHTRGDLDFAGTPQTFSAKGALALGPGHRLANIALDVQGTPEAVQIAQFDIVQPKGRLNATGKVDLKPAIAWNLSARAHGFDPGAFAVGWPGALTFDIASDGRMTQQGPAGSLRLKQLSGDLRGRKLTGTADLALQPPLLVAGVLSLRSGRSKIELTGKRADALDARLTFRVASLGDWLPDSSGELTGQFDVRGRWPALSIDGAARGRELYAANVGIDTLELTADVHKPLDPRGVAEVDLTGLAAGSLGFKSVQARASGSSDAHELTLRAAGEPLALDLRVQGKRTADGWSGSVQQLVLDVQDAARLALREPVGVVMAKGAVDVSEACLADNRIELCARGRTQPDGAVEAAYSLAGVPLALANVLGSPDMPLKFAGEIGGRGELRRTAQGELFGAAQIRSADGRISREATAASHESPAESQVLLSYSDLNLTANLDGASARATVNVRVNDNGSVNGEATLRGLGEEETSVAGQASVSIPDLAPFAVLAPQVANVHGRVDARAKIAGTLQAPEIAGEMTASALAADVPAAGLHLKAGRLQVRPANMGKFDISGSVSSGDGHLELGGKASAAGDIDLRINGDRFLAADIPGARVIVSPALQFARAAEHMTLKGDVTIPQADVNLQKLPRGDRARSPSPDVVVVDARTQEPDATETTPLNADINVILGEKVNLTGFGLVASLNGRLAVRERPGEPTAGSGEIRVAGTYKAYGQDLTIQRGQLLYSATPLSNPRLNIEATRQVDEITAGLRVRGSAQAPELTVFSDPEMGQANALSYLVAGKPLEDIGSNDSDGDALQAASRSLGAAAGGLLAKNGGRRLGVDELAVKDEEQLGGAALTVGQYLSPRLYLSYGVGLFEPGDVVTLRYKLSREFALQTQRGPQDTRAGIEYRIER